MGRVGSIASVAGQGRMRGHNMSEELYKLGDRQQAIEHAEAALKIFEQIEDPSAAAVRRRVDIWRSG
jgi:hypothetical protein